MDTREIILNVENLNTTFISDKKKIHIVKDVSFQVKRGKTLAVVGESGCGKSVTMNSVMRFLGRNAIVEAKSIQYNALKNGEVKEYHLEQVKNKDINGSMMRELRGPDMAMVFQDPMSSLNPVYKVGNQVAEGFLQHNRGMTKKQAREKVLEMFRKLGIPDPEERIDCYPHQFSGGMKQRVVIAIAMICNPDLIICDEPTTALDVTIQAQIMELLKELQVKEGKSIVLITHNMGLVAEMADEVCVMYMGRAEDLFSRLKAVLAKNGMKQKDFLIGLIEEALKKEEAKWKAESAEATEPEEEPSETELEEAESAESETDEESELKEAETEEEPTESEAEEPESEEPTEPETEEPDETASDEADEEETDETESETEETEPETTELEDAEE